MGTEITGLITFVSGLMFGFIIWGGKHGKA